MKITLVNKYFYPDKSATSQLLSDLAESLVCDGHHVRVITGRQLYTSPEAKLPRRETVNNIEVVRLGSTTFGRGNSLGRAADSVTLLISLICFLLLRLQKNELVVCCTDPPMLSVPVSLCCSIKRARLVNWLQDVYPDVAVRLGLLAENSLITAFLNRMMRKSLARAVVNVTIGELMAEKISSRLNQQAVEIVHNWCDSESIQPMEKELNSLRSVWFPRPAFVVGYSGNLGKAHEIDTLLSSARALRNREDIRFLIIGEGALKDSLVRRAQHAGLENIQFQPYQPREKLPLSLTVSDVHLISLKPELEGLIVPSKFYGIAAAGRASIFIGSSGGELARILKEHDCGVTVSPGNETGLTEAITFLADNPERCKQMGSNARRVTDTTYNRKASLEKWSRLLDRCSQG